MAYIGLAKPTIAKLAEPGNTYSDAFTCGKAIQIDITPQYAEGSLYGDNIKAEYDKEFKYADVTLNTTTMPVKAHELMFGHTVKETAITFNASDESGYVGFGFYVNEKVDGVKKFTASWLYKVKFAEGAESYKTKGDNIEYQTPSVTGQAMALDNGDWKDVKTFDTEAEAAAWLMEKSSQEMDPEIMVIAGSGKEIYEKDAGEMMSNGKILSDGTVLGEFHYVTGYTGFNGSKTEEQEGYFFPFELKRTGTKMTFKKNGQTSKNEIPWEADNVFRVTAGDTFTILVDDEEVVTLNFSSAKFEEKA